MIYAIVVNTQTDRFQPVILLQVSEYSSYDLCYRGYHTDRQISTGYTITSL